MLVCKRVLAALAILLATAVLLLSLVGGIGVWVVKEPVTARTTQVFQRIDAALDLADRGLEQARTSLARAAERLDSAREEQRKLSQQPQPNNAAKKTLARTVQRSIAPEFDKAHGKLQTVAEAAVVVNSVLADLGNIPFLSASGLDGDQLADLNRQLGEVGPAAWELSRRLGEGEPDSDAQFSQVDQALRTVREAVDEYEPRLRDVRQRTEELQARTLGWITPASILLSVIFLWVALSQVSILFHIWAWVRGPRSV